MLVTKNLHPKTLSLNPSRPDYVFGLTADAYFCKVSGLIASSSLFCFFFLYQITDIKLKTPWCTVPTQLPIFHYTRNFIPHSALLEVARLEPYDEPS